MWKIVSLIFEKRLYFFSSLGKGIQIEFYELITAKEKSAKSLTLLELQMYNTPLSNEYGPLKNYQKFNGYFNPDHQSDFLYDGVFFEKLIISRYKTPLQNTRWNNLYMFYLQILQHWVEFYTQRLALVKLNPSLTHFCPKINKNKNGYFVKKRWFY